MVAGTARRPTGDLAWTAPQAGAYQREQFGRWVRNRRGAWPEPAEDQQELLAAIGIVEDLELTARTATAMKTAGRRNTGRLQQGLAQYVGWVGYAKVPSGHKEIVEPAPG